MVRPFSFSKIAKFTSSSFFHQLIRYVIVGVCSALLEITILVVLVEVFHWDYLRANIIAFPSTNIFNYYVSRKWVFTSENEKKISEFFLFMAFVSIGLGINQIVLWVFVDYINLDYRIAKVIAIAIAAIWNFATRKHFIFKSGVLSKKSVLQHRD